MTDTLELANTILKAALSCGFRESGIMNSGSPTTLAIRTTGLAFDCIIGYYASNTQKICQMVDESYLQILLKVANLRFKDNERRRELFSKALDTLLQQINPIQGTSRVNWEDKKTRKERLKLEGLTRKSKLKEMGQKECFTTPSIGAEADEEDDSLYGQLLAL